MLTYSFEEMYNFAKNCNREYDGKFFVAVKTTSIFCIPSCKAKFPLPQNLEFFETKEEALSSGYRGCRRCYSDKWPFNDPPWLSEIENYMKQNLLNRISEKELSDIAGVDPTTLRRYFKKKHKISLMDYYRSIKLDKAKDLLIEKSVSEVAVISGFKSVKGFSIAFEKKFGQKPSQIKKKNVVDDVF